jgi:hypothetical protein
MEKEAIDDAFAATLGGLFKTMFISYAAAGDSLDAKETADNAFASGLALAREVHARASTYLKDE